jgi:3-deoxy-D-manno-octulosonic-acid transferase
VNQAATAPSPGIGYRLLSFPLYLFWMLHALKHGFKHGLPGYLSMRMFGCKGSGDTRIWVHASSVGEVHAISPLVQALMQRGERILFTAFTATGYRAIQDIFANTVVSTVIPIDQCWACRRFFRQHGIKLGLVMETELWPELLYQAHRQRVELLLVNARLTRKSLDAGSFVRGLLSTTLGYFSQILARNKNDQHAFARLGVSEDRIQIVGNLKLRDQGRKPQSRLIERDYVILASSHPGEEQQFLAARPPQCAQLLIVLAPRHPDRSVKIQAEIDSLGMTYAVRSKAQTIDPDTEVYLADTLGELPSLMAHARVVIMGGSFDTTGGHNLIEAASLGRAIITGPSDSNIADDIEILGAGQGLLQVENMSACWASITELLAQPARAEALGREAKSRVAQQPDIVQRYLDAIDNCL